MVDKRHPGYYVAFGVGTGMFTIGFFNMIGFKFPDTYLLAFGVLICALIYRYVLADDPVVKKMMGTKE